MQPDNQDQPAERGSVRVVTPEQFLKLLRDLPPATEDKGASAGASDDDKKEKYRPATADEVGPLLRRQQLEVGDIVQLQPRMAGMFKWPKPGQDCIVTQVIDPPYRSGEHGTAQLGETCDIALGYVLANGPGGREVLCEFVHDSRNFDKVGRIAPPR